MRSLALLGSFLLLLVAGAVLVIRSQGPLKLDVNPLLKKPVPAAQTESETAATSKTTSGGSSSETASGSGSPGSSTATAQADQEPRHPALKGLDPLLWRLNGNSISNIKRDEIRVRYVLVYFSAHWCPPCRAFTPNLVRFYKANFKKAREKGKSFEVVFVSNDEDESGMLQYSYDAQMTWMAMKPGDGMSSSLARLCGPGIPCLVLLGPAGEVISTSVPANIGPNDVLTEAERLLN